MENCEVGEHSLLEHELFTETDDSFLYFLAPVFQISGPKTT